ncbi:MAG: type 4a pilus biogenesis protein PilO [Actinomycetota bacterium]
MDNPRAPIFAAAGAVVIAILLVVFLVLPKIGQVSSAKDDLAAAQSEQQTLETQKSALEDTKAQAPANRQAIDEVHQKIPPTAEEPSLLLLINNSAIDSGLDLTTLAPSPPVFDAATGLSIIVLSMSATGTYNEITSFSYHIETLPRAAKITSLSLAPGSGTDSLGNEVLTATLQIDAYTSDTSAGPGSVPGPSEVGG